MEVRPQDGCVPLNGQIATFQRLTPKENAMQTRRKFIQIVPVAGAALLAGREVLAQARPADALDPKSHQLPAVPGQGHGPLGRLPALRRQEGGR